MNYESSGNMDSTAQKRSIPSSLKWIGRVFAVFASLLVVFAREGLGPPYLDAAGKAVFWTGIVFVPLLGLNQDVLQIVSGKLLAILLWLVQLTLVFHFFAVLNGLTFIELTPLCVVQFVIFALPFMLIRKRFSGIWY